MRYELTESEKPAATPVDLLTPDSCAMLAHVGLFFLWEVAWSTEPENTFDLIVEIMAKEDQLAGNV